MKHVHNVRRRWSANRAAGKFVVFAIALTGSALPARAAFTSIITCNPAVSAPAGSLIDKPGDYQVNANLSGTGDCILVTASNVSLKLNGHTIASTAHTGAGINVSPPSGRVDHVGISGPGLVMGYNNGVRFNNADYSQVSLISASANSTNGIVASNVTFLTVGSNVLTVNTIWGLLLTNSVNSVVQLNDMSGNGLGSPSIAGGMRVTGAANTVNNNTVNGNGGQGAVGTTTFNGGILIGAQGTRVYSNTTNGNLGPGIEVSGSGNQIFHNTSVTGSSLLDLKDDNANCGTNTWSDNVFFTSSPSSCIH